MPMRLQSTCVGTLPSFFRVATPPLRQLEGVPALFSISIVDSSLCMTLASVLHAFAAFGRPPLPPPPKNAPSVRFVCLYLGFVFRFRFLFVCRALTSVFVKFQTVMPVGNLFKFRSSSGWRSPSFLRIKVFPDLLE